MAESESDKSTGTKLRMVVGALGWILVVAAGVWIYLDFVKPPDETYGQVVVDLPEIYTRERLVNDRFVEDAWLRRRLKESDQSDFVPEGMLSRRDLAAMQAAVSAETAPAAPGSDPAASEPAGSGPAGSAPQRSPMALFRSQLSYRGEIRNLIIENQLDDRHDLLGNSLYRLKFDASVLPGDNTRASALISITLKERKHDTLSPKDLLFTDFAQKAPDELKRWRTLFADWIDDVDANINQALSDLKHDYEHGRFSPEYQKEMVNVAISLRQLKGCDDIDTLVENVKLGSESDGVLTSFEDNFQELRKCDTGSGQRTFMSQTADPASDKAQLVAKSPDKIRRVGKKKEDLRTGEIINRFAAPKLLRLTFGSGIIGTFQESIKSWTFFHPYADLVANYPDEEHPFVPRAKKTTLRLVLPDQAGGHSCVQPYTLVPWHSGTFPSLPADESGGFCVALAPEKLDESPKGEEKETGQATLKIEPLTGFLTAMDVSAGELVGLLSESREVKETLADLAREKWAVAYIPIETGLFSFIRKLQSSGSVFSYAVTPKQTVQSLGVDEELGRQAGVSAAGAGIGARLSGARDAGFRGFRDQPLVVGYGNALNGGHEGAQKIEFGWFISPPVVGTQGGEERKAHVAVQYALTALVSVPAWWDKIDLSWESYWLGHDDTKIPISWPDDSGSTKDSSITIDLPRDLESISSLLLSRGAGPEIEEDKMVPIVVTVCRPAEILLPGRRLWRSAVVTLGAQIADEIQVLPNMRGIIAKFDGVHVPSEWTGGTLRNVPVTVWTSEGSRTLINRAQILPPFGQEALKANGTCREEMVRERSAEPPGETSSKVTPVAQQ